LTERPQERHRKVDAVKAARYNAQKELVFEDVAPPLPGPDEALVRVHAAGVNPVDWKSARPGLIPGWDIAGIIEASAAACDGDKLREGDAVFGLGRIRRQGAYRELIAIRQRDLALKPRLLDFTHAAAVPLAALTAWQSLVDRAGLQPGQQVLIHAAAGGVGTFAVQFAHILGARVIATASAANHDLVSQLGADEVIDYTTTSFDNIVSGVDVVLDTIGGETRLRSWRTLAPGGVLVALSGTPQPPGASSRRVRGVALGLVHPSRTQLERIAELIDDAHVRAIVQQVFPLDQAAQAQQLSRAGHVRGKLVLVP
jgi:NADPH:quinone reductase-like Zn-dependent oxidoreductase